VKVISTGFQNKIACIKLMKLYERKWMFAPWIEW
jgi:hypothetical protein